MIDAVIFDWGGTLTPWHVLDYRAQWDRFAEGYGTLACARNELASALLLAEDAAWARARTEHTSTTLADVLRSAGVESGPAASAGEAAYFNFWEAHGRTLPEVEPVWQGLHERGIKVGVLSNTIWTREYHRRLFERDGVLDLIDADVYSSEVSWTKPHPEIFREAARRLDVAPERCVYVGDRLYEDVHGPQQVGMRAIFVPHSSFPAEQLVETESTPDGIAHDLGDVLTLVDAWTA